MYWVIICSMYDVTKASILKLISDRSNYWSCDGVFDDIFLGIGHNSYVVFIESSRFTNS